MYQFLVLEPQRRCYTLSGLGEWEGSRCLTETSAANAPCMASLDHLGWEGCAVEEILLSTCGLSPPPPPQRLPGKAPPPADKPKPPALPPPPPTHQTQQALHAQAQVLRIKQHLIVGPGDSLCLWEEGEGLAAAAAKAVRGALLFGGG